MAVLETIHLSKLYAPGRGIADVTLTIEAGEVLGLVGPNGSGKSTLLAVLSTHLRPTAGSFRILGHDGLREPRAVRPLLGYVPEGTPHWGDLSAYQNAWFFARAYGLDDTAARERLEELLAWAGLWEQRHDLVKNYSYGMKRKLLLVEALAHRPPLLLWDEPSLGLDYPSQLALRERLADLAAEGTAVLIATNDVFLAEAVCHRVVFVNRAQVVAEGRPADFLATLGGRVKVTLTLSQPVAPAILQAVAGVEAVSSDSGSLRLVATDRPGLLTDLVRAVDGAGGRLADFQVQVPNLGDVFLQKTGDLIDK